MAIPGIGGKEVLRTSREGLFSRYLYCTEAVRLAGVARFKDQNTDVSVPRRLALPISIIRRLMATYSIISMCFVLLKVQK